MFRIHGMGFVAAIFVAFASPFIWHYMNLRVFIEFKNLDNTLYIVMLGCLLISFLLRILAYRLIFDPKVIIIYSSMALIVFAVAPFFSSYLDPLTLNELLGIRYIITPQSILDNVYWYTSALLAGSYIPCLYILTGLICGRNINKEIKANNINQNHEDRVDWAKNGLEEISKMAEELEYLTNLDEMDEDNDEIITLTDVVVIKEKNDYL